MVLILSLLVVIVQSVLLVQSEYTITQLKYELFESDKLASFREFEKQNLDENFFQRDYTKAPRNYNTSKCIDDLFSVLKNLWNGDKESVKCKIDSGFS